MLDKTEYKQALYYCSRYLAWFAVFSLLVSGPADRILGIVTAKFEVSQAFEIVGNLLTIVLDLYLQKVILNKVFFKKYKYIVITPKFESVTWWFNIKICLQFFVVSLLALLSTALVYIASFSDIRSLLIEQLDNSVEMPIMTFKSIIVTHWTILPVVVIFVIIAYCALLKRIVLKNAEVLNK